MRHPVAGVMVLALVLAGCLATPSASPSPRPTPSVTPSPSASTSASPTTAASPSPTPEPSLSLDLPSTTDDRRVAVAVAADVADDGGRIVVTVTSTADTRIDELVIRWPTALADTIFLAPFEPSEERIRDGGPPLVQPWTKWVVGPGEQGEPDGTTSLGWGPLLAGATLEIPIVVTRVGPGPIAFDLQVLAGNDLLALDDGTPAEIRVEVP